MSCKKDEKVRDTELILEESKNDDDEVKLIDNTNSEQISENMITPEIPLSKKIPVSTSQPTSVVPIRPRVVLLPKFRKVPTNSADITQVSGGQFVMRSGQQFISALTAVPANVAKSVNAATPIILPSSGTSVIPGKSQIMLQASKSLNNSIRNIVPVSVSTPNGSKQQFAYLGTIIKPVIGSNGKSSENQILTHLPVSLVPTPTNQKLVLTPLGGNQKLSSTSRRMSTDTKSTNMQSKITSVILPVTSTSTFSKAKTKTPVINLKITNGQLQQTDHEGAITVLQETNNTTPKLPPLQPLTKMSPVPISPVVTSSVTEQKSVDNEKEYTLSIPESDTNFLDADSSFELSIKENSTDSVEVTCTISNTKDNKDVNNKEASQQTHTQTQKIDEQESSGNVTEQPIKKIHEVAILKKPKLLFQDAEWKKARADVIAAKVDKKTNEENNSLNVVTLEPVPQTDQISSEKPMEFKKNEVAKTVSERRRKSHNTVLKDYDEIEFTPALSPDYEESPTMKYKSNADITFKKLSIRDELVTKSKVAVDDVQIEVIKKELPPIELTTDEDFDPAKLLEWNDGIGSLPGSDLKFHMNEFGFMQMVTDADIAQIKAFKRESDMKAIGEIANTINAKIPKKNSSNGLFCCEVCGCYGYGSEFVNSMFCSYTCSEKYIQKGTIDSKYNRKKEKKISVISNNKIDSNEAQRSESATPAQSDDDTNDTLENKYTYPWLGGKKGFSWAKYLTHVNAKAAPVKLFKDPYPYSKNGFKVGMKLEGIDPQHPSYYCVLTVAEVLGYRIRLHFDGYPDNHDFWTNADSLDIFPAGWCDKNNHKLHPPLGCLQSSFNWNTYLKQCKAQPAPRNLFLNKPENSLCPNGFRLGMKLEAVDRKNSSLVCVASVADIMDNRILVHFDSWDDIYDYWADPASPYIHPVGWCEEKGHSLTPPNNYKDPNEFTWENYLKETKSQAAPARAFKQRPSNGFKKGMRLECVDRRVPKLIRVATVDDVRDHQIRISFDGWPDKYSYWIDDDGHDIHPVGWCQKTGHPLQPPLTPEDIYSTECSTPGCRGVGNIKGPQYENHQSAITCPYSDQNFDKDFTPDRLLGHLKIKIDEAVPLSKEPKRHAADSTTTKLGRPPKIRRPYYNESDDEWQINDKIRKKKRKRNSSPEQDDSSNNFTSKIRVLPDSVLIKSVTQDNFDPVLIPDPNKVTPFHWEKHSKNLNCYVSDITDPRSWCEQKVVDFIGSIPSCKELSPMFNKHKIDGEALLMLSQNDLTSILGFKLGPAIKLYNSIILLREKVLKYY